jgi:drug/metabolite transporter (DMT)-like permease
LKRPRNWILFLFVVFVWGSGWSVMKVALAYVDPLNFALQRFALSALALSPLLIYVRGKIRIDNRTALKLLLLSAINTSSVVQTYWGLTYETSGIGAILTYTQPLFVFCLCVLFLRNEAKPVRLLGAFVGFFGVIVLSVGRAGSIQFSANIGDILLLFGAFLWAVAIVYYKKSLGNVDPILTSIIQQALGAVIVAPLVLNVERFSFPLTRPYLMMILYLGIFGSGTTVFLWLYLIRQEDVTVLSLSSFLIPMIAVFLGWLFLAENIQTISILGIAMILTGLYLTNRAGSSS